MTGERTKEPAKRPERFSAGKNEQVNNATLPEKTENRLAQAGPHKQNAQPIRKGKVRVKFGDAAAYPKLS